MANYLGKHKGTVNNWIIRDTVPPADLALKISELLKTNISFLITGYGSEDEYLFKRIKYDDEFKDAVNQLARLQDKERYKIYGMIDNYSRESSEEVKRESETG